MKPIAIDNNPIGEDLTGVRIGRVTYLKQLSGTKWEGVCDCGGSVNTSDFRGRAAPKLSCEKCGNRITDDLEYICDRISLAEGKLDPLWDIWREDVVEFAIAERVNDWFLAGENSVNPSWLDFGVFVSEFGEECYGKEIRPVNPNNPLGVDNFIMTRGGGFWKVNSSSKSLWGGITAEESAVILLNELRSLEQLGLSLMP